jgi:hypothetical protein
MVYEGVHIPFEVERTAAAPAAPVKRAVEFDRCK